MLAILIAIHFAIGALVLTVILRRGLPINGCRIAGVLSAGIIVLTWPLIVALAYQK